MMIVTKDKNVWVNNPADDIKDIDGAHYGIICSKAIPKDVTVPLDALVYICSIYVPEVYGTYSSAQNYPYVEIPYKQDIDDEGHEPEIGELCKVMFEAGKSYVCRLVYYIKINEQIKELNKNYILHGILPSNVIDKPDNPADYTQFSAEFLDLAYYATTGHKKSELTYNDFVPCCLGSKKGSGKKDKSPAKNYFCKALSVPFMSYFTEDYFDMGVPINASSKYNVANILLSIYNTNISDVATIDKYFNDADYDWLDEVASLYQIYNQSKGKVDNLEKLMEKIVLSVLSYCNPRFTKLLFPEVKDLPDDISSQLSMTISNDNYTYAERVWDVFANSNFDTEKFYMSFPKTMYQFRKQFEKEWASAMLIYESGFNSKMIDANNLKLKHTILLCLTVCPWLAYPLIGYYDEVALSDELNESLRRNGQDPRNFRTYSTYLNSYEEFTEIQKKLDTLIKSEPEPLQFVSSFRDIAYSIFGDSKLFIHLEANNKNTWDYYKMDDKFKRLKDALPKYLETIV